MSISISLVAVFIPLLLMGGIIGRLFREFAITVTMTIVVSAFVSLTLSPMMCALFLRDEQHAQPRPRSTWRIERGFERLLPRYDARPRLRAASPAPDAASCSSPRWRSPVLLYVIVPKGFFPQQDTGIIIGPHRRVRRTSRSPR